MSRTPFAARLVLAALAILVSRRPAHAITSEEFRLRSGADLVALCSTPASDSMYSAAIHMCHGYGVGAYQALVAVTRHKKLDHTICPPDPPITRNEGVQAFLDWAKGKGQSQLNEPAIDTLGRFFLAKFPCDK